MADATGPVEAVAALTDPAQPHDRAGAPPAASLRRAGLLLGLSTTTANVLGYAFAIVLSRSLGPASYGALAALLAAGLIGSIPGIALQLVVARARSSDQAHGEAEAARWVRLSVLVGIGLMLLTWLLAPAAESYLSLDGPAPVLWLGLVMLSGTITGALQGRLLGAEQHARLSATYVAVAGFRFLSGLFAAAAGWSISGALGAAAVAGALACAAAAGLAGVPAPGTGGRGYLLLSRELVTASSSTAAILVLSNVDVVLARHYLSGAASGHYAVGSLFTKAAFWGPHFLAVIAYPRLARRSDRMVALRAALALTLCIGTLAVVFAAVAGRAVIDGSAGTAYADVSGIAPAFAGLGTAMAMLQLTIYAGLARERRITEMLVWVGILAEIGLVATSFHRDPAQIVYACLSVAAAVTLAAVAVELVGRWHGREGQ